jgi:hypothetical protein
LIIAGYFVVSIIIYGVLTKVTEKAGWRTPKAHKAIIILALIWPVWGEFAFLVVVAYGLLKGLHAFTASVPKNGSL